MVKNFSVDLPIIVEDLSGYQKAIYNLIPEGTTKLNSIAPLLCEDIYLSALRLENEHGESVCVTRIECHIGHKIRPSTLLGVLDQLRVPYIAGVSWFGTSDASIESQIARKSLSYARGSVICLGTAPKQDAVSGWALADARQTQIDSLEARCEKRLNLINAKDRQLEERATKIVTLQAEIDVLKAQASEPLVGQKRVRTDDEFEEIRALLQREQAIADRERAIADGDRMKVRDVEAKAEARIEQFKTHCNETSAKLRSASKAVTQLVKAVRALPNISEEVSKAMRAADAFRHTINRYDWPAEPTLTQSRLTDMMPRVAPPPKQQAVQEEQEQEKEEEEQQTVVVDSDEE